MGLVVDPFGGTCGGQGSNGAVIGQHLVAAFDATPLLDVLEHTRGRLPDGYGVRVLGRQLICLRQHAKTKFQISDRYGRLGRFVVVVGHSENCTRG